MQCHFIQQLNEIDLEQLQQLIPERYPFLQPAFLNALEQSESVNGDSGWRVHHLVIEQGEKLLAFMPLYIKQHSYGEYVFDWSWAQAYQQHGFLYYPKLLSAIPFTPASGPRFIHHPDYSLNDLWPLALEHIQLLMEKTHASGWHCLFPPGSSVEQLQTLSPPELELLKRSGVQYHWFNRDYQSFDDFLACFNSRKRKNLRKERQRVSEQGLTLIRKQKADISADEWQLFFHCYQATYAKRSGHGGYLNQDFFRYLAQDFNQQIMMVIAYDNKQQGVAAALSFFDDQTLYGRYWGCLREYDYLHFEACYYQGIEFCIEQGLQHFDPGAQGEHKIQRGFEPVSTCSLHHLRHPDFQRAIKNFVAEEARQLQHYKEEAGQLLPFKRHES